MPIAFISTDVFAQISLLIVIAAVISGIVRILKQPVIVGYILTGVLVGPYLLNGLGDQSSFEVFSTIGISILLFIVGLNLSPRAIKDVGKSAVAIGFAQIAICTLLGLVLGRLFGFSLVESLYISVAFSFSSTIIVLKLLSDKKEIETLPGRISVGVLLVQDIIAVIALITAAASSSAGGLSALVLTFAKALAAFGILFLVGHFILPRLSGFFARSQEYLFLFSIAWGFGLATLFKLLGLSYEIGALVAGVSLSITPYATEAGAKLKPLRDFFLIIFFVLLGTKVVFVNMLSLWPSVLVFSALVLVVKPAAVTLLTALAGYNKKTSFLVGMSLGQVSEFSLVLLALGIKFAQASQNALTLVTGVAFISIAVSTYTILYSEKIYPYFSKRLRFLDRKKFVAETSIANNFDVILFGCNRAGYDFIKTFRHLGAGLLCVDFDPDVIKKLKAEGINCIYGDAEDPEFLEEINVGSAKLVVSTIPEGEANEYLLTRIRGLSNKAIVVLISYNIEEAIRLYEKGATYVILPHFIGGEYAASLMHSAGFDVTKLNEKREKHIAYLKERKALGHSHP